MWNPHEWELWQQVLMRLDGVRLWLTSTSDNGFRNFLTSSMGSVALKSFLISFGLRIGLNDGLPSRSIGTSLPSLRRLIVSQTPIRGPGPSMSLGTSIAIELTFPSPKVSFPFHSNSPCAPLVNHSRTLSASAKKGSLRVPTNKRQAQASTGAVI